MVDSGRKIPRTMSTQHPDNARVPEWCSLRDVIQGDDEIYEAYYAYSILGCEEVMWDSEGKDVDIRVVRKLLEKYGEFFREKVIGEDVFLTYRVPNPRVEEAERKILVETLTNIIVGYDVASAFYGRSVTPTFEVILPFTTEARELIWLRNYYEKAIAGVEKLSLDGSVKVRDWLGEFRPRSIEVIPLIEEWNGLANIDKIIGDYIEDTKLSYLRVFIARSDPALNYGMIPAVALAKIALSKLKRIQEEKGLPIYPIIGCGTMPFRGHLSPDNLENFLEEYRGVYTVTIQSALKYDYDPETVRIAVERINNELPRGEAEDIDPDEERILIQAIARLRDGYQKVIEKMAPLINSVAKYIPPRRARKLHIGLFGYSRSIGRISLPRAIPFAGALYSIGIPPEFIGLKSLNDLSEQELEILEKIYRNLWKDLDKAAVYVSWQNLDVLRDALDKAAERTGMSREELKTVLDEIIVDLEYAEENLGIRLGPRNLSHLKYENMANNFLISYLEGEDELAKEYLLETAKLRRCIG